MGAVKKDVLLILYIMSITQVTSRGGIARGWKFTGTPGKSISQGIVYNPEAKLISSWIPELSQLPLNLRHAPSATLAAQVKEQLGAQGLLEVKSFNSPCQQQGAAEEAMQGTTTSSQVEDELSQTALERHDRSRELEKFEALLQPLRKVYPLPMVDLASQLGSLKIKKIKGPAIKAKNP